MFKLLRNSVLLILAVALCALSAPVGAAVAQPAPALASVHSADGKAGPSGASARVGGGICMVTADDPFQQTAYSGSGVPLYPYVGGISSVDCKSTDYYSVAYYVWLEKRKKVSGVWKWVEVTPHHTNTTSGPHASISATVECSVVGHGEFRTAGYIAVTTPVEDTAADQSNPVTLC